MTSLAEVVFRSLGKFYLGGNAFSDKFQILRPSDSTNPMVNVNTISSRFELNNADLKFLNSSNGETSTIGTSGITTPGSVLINGSNSATKFQVLNNSSGSVFSVNTETNETVADGDLFLRGTGQRTIRSANDVKIQVPNQRVIRFHGTTVGGVADPVIAINTGVYTLHPLKLTTTLGKSDAPWATTFTKQLDMDKFKILTTENLPNTVTNQVIYEPVGTFNTAGRFIIGDGSGWILRFCKRVGSLTTDFVMMRDDGSIYPAVGSTSTLGLVNSIWAELYVRDIISTGKISSTSANVTGTVTANNITVNQNANVSGNITVGSVSGVGAILPSVDNGTVDIGSPTKRFRNIYGNNITMSADANITGGMTAGNANITGGMTAGSANITGGMTAGSANITGGATIAGGVTITGGTSTGATYITGFTHIENLEISDTLYSNTSLNYNALYHDFKINGTSVIQIYDYFSGENYLYKLYPSSTTDTNLGTSTNKWNEVFAENGVINTSDMNLKNTVITSDLGLEFIESLHPVSYKFNKSRSGRTHYGLISQEIEQTLLGFNKNAINFAGFCKDKKNDDSGEYIYGLRYTEFISPMIKAIQELSAIVKTQEQRIIELENKI